MGLAEFFIISKSIEEKCKKKSAEYESSKSQAYQKLSSDLKERLKQPIVDFKTQTLDLVEKIQQNIDNIADSKIKIQQIEENIKIEIEKLKELINLKKQMKEELSNSKLKTQELISKFNQDLDNIISKV